MKMLLRRYLVSNVENYRSIMQERDRVRLEEVALRIYCAKDLSIEESIIVAKKFIRAMDAEKREIK